MTQHPYGSDELDRVDPELDGVAHELERYAARRSGDAPAGLAATVKEAIAAEPDPAIGWWQRLVAGPAAWGATGRSIAVAAVVMLLLVGSVAVGQLLNVAGPNVGSSPSPAISPSERPTPSSPASPSSSPSPSPSASPTRGPSTPAATPSDDDDDETPEPEETPEASDDDNSGPGGGDDNETPEPSDDSSGPGGGGGDDD